MTTTIQSVPTGIRVYVGTFSTTAKHVENPDRTRQTLCRRRVSLYGRDTTRAHRWMVYELPTCEVCEQAATRRGLVEGPEVHREEQPRVIRYLMRLGAPHIADVDCVAVTLCGYACGRNAHLDDPGQAEVCGECVDIAARLSYQPAA